jgi:cyclic beta-1,2-glucan synthetase
VAALMVLKQFSLRFGQIISKTFDPRPRRFEGVRDTFARLIARIQEIPEVRSKNAPRLQKMKDLLHNKPVDTNEQETLLTRLKEELDAMGKPAHDDPELQNWWNAAVHVLDTHLADYARPQDIPRRLLAIAREAEDFYQEIDFRFLYNEERGVFSIGFNVTNGQLDGSSYDLFASEARLTSFAAIAKGDVPQSHWFRMARHLVSIGRRRVAVSWSGSMFEYVMPLLFMRNEPNTLLDETYRTAVLIHRLYGKSKNVPWGISEAAYNVQDHSGNYQYGPFGVPRLGLKRGLGNKLVIAPYATFLAALVDPRSSIKNLDHLERYKMRGRFGFYESLDFTAEDLAKGEKWAVIRAFMAHHQGMSLVALDNLLNDDLMQKRFHAEAAVQATELLLQEKMPLATRSTTYHVVNERMEVPRTPEPIVAREFRSPFISPPRTQILSNGNYQVVLTTGGSGYSECRKFRITRWREDITRDPWGTFIYLKDLKNGRVWSAGFHPVCRVPDFYSVTFHEDRVEYRRRDAVIETQLDVVVSTEDDAEIRRLTLVNTSQERVEIELTSYLEVVLNLPPADLAHPAFSNLFINTEFVPMNQCLLACRRPQSADEAVPWSGHVVMSENPPYEEVEFETDRARFVGRTRNLSSPHSMEPGIRLSKTTGAVLDPIFSLRRKVEIEPYSRVVIAFTTVYAGSREDAISACEKYSTSRGVRRAFELTHAHAQVMLKQLGLTLEEAHLFQRIAGRLIYSDLSLRPSQAVLASNIMTQSGLWAFGISGDLPICLVRIEDVEELDIVRQLLRAHDYWRLKGFMVDLVILNEHPSSYFQDLQEAIMNLIHSTPSTVLLDKPGGVFVRRADQMTEEERTLLRAVARVQIVAQRGSLAKQVARVDRRDPLPPLQIPLSTFPIHEEPLPIHPPSLQFENGYGGFTQDGREYVVVMKDGLRTPAPWINVISNPKFGFQISETGSEMTWSINSRENRVTPWSNDPVQDPIGSAIYIRDEESGEFWSPTLLPSTGKGTYLAAHGIGYSRFHYGGGGIEHVMSVYVPPDQPVKIVKLNLRNHTRRSRWLSATYYADLVLGVTKSQSAPFVITSIDQETGAVFARNPYNNEFSGRVTFAAMNDRKRTVTADRTMFLGPNGDPSNPAAMSYAHVTGRVGAGLDPCVAIQGQIRLNPLSENTVIFSAWRNRR